MRISDWSSDVCSSDLTVVSPRVAAPVKGGVDLGKPTFRMGYATLPVEDPYRELQVRVTPSKQDAKPREAVRVELAATPRHASGEPIEFAVAVLDEAVFDLIQGGSTDRKSTRLNSSH